jgi:hypothetical protein
MSASLLLPLARKKNSVQKKSEDTDKHEISEILVNKFNFVKKNNLYNLTIHFIQSITYHTYMYK